MRAATHARRHSAAKARYHIGSLSRFGTEIQSGSDLCLLLGDLFDGKPKLQGADLNFGQRRNVDRAVALQALAIVDGAVGGAEILDHDLCTMELEGQVELRHIRSVDVQFVELIAAQPDGKTLETHVEALLRLSIVDLYRQRNRHRERA